jgi:hypothetical protein
LRVVVVTGTVVVVVELVEVVVSPGYVVVVVAGTVVVVVAGTVVVVVGLVEDKDLGGDLFTLTVTTACHATSVPAAGDWRAALVQELLDAPAPTARSTSWLECMTAMARALLIPTTFGTRRLG